MYGIEQALKSGLGPLTGAMPTTSTIPLTGSGVLNNTQSTAAVKVLSANTDPKGKIRRCTLTCLTAGRNLSYVTVPAGTSAPTLTAVGDGASANDGLLIVGGGGASRDFSIADNLDLYISASLAGTAFQLAVVDQ
jgi:hypothetical protein